jgi:hypothetical protein
MACRNGSRRCLFWLAVAVSADDLDDFLKFRRSEFRTFRHIAAIRTDGFFDDALLHVVAQDAACFRVDVTVVPDGFFDAEIVVSALRAFSGLEHGFYPSKEALHDTGKKMGGCVMTCLNALYACGRQNALICQLVSLAMASVMRRQVFRALLPVPAS